jgi:hypothetical protein
MLTSKFCITNRLEHLFMFQKSVAFLLSWISCLDLSRHSHLKMWGFHPVGCQILFMIEIFKFLHFQCLWKQIEYSSSVFVDVWMVPSHKDETITLYSEENPPCSQKPGSFLRPQIPQLWDRFRPDMNWGCVHWGGKCLIRNLCFPKRSCWDVASWPSHKIILSSRTHCGSLAQCSAGNQAIHTWPP